MDQSLLNTADLLERITDAFVALDKNWCYTYMNKKAGEIFSRDPAKMTGKHIWTEFPEGIDQPFYKAYYRAMAEQQYIHVEEYYPPYNKWFENHIYPSPDGLSIFFRDITEKKKTEERLAQSQKRFRALVENNEGIISLVDEKLNVLFRSASAARITGWTNEEFEKTNAAEYIHPDDLEGLRSTMTKAMQNAGETIPIEIRVKHKEGHYIWLEGVVKNMMHDPAIGGIITNMRDITEKKKTEEELNQNHAFIESIINASPHIIYIYDIEERKNVFSNDGIQTNLGYTSDEIKEIGDQVLPLLMPKEDFDDYLKNIYPRYATLKDKEILTHEFRMKHKTGNWRWLFTKESVFLRKPDGTPKQIFGVTTDITERKIAEEGLRSEKDRFEKIVNTVPGVIYISKLRPDGSACFPYFSPAMFDMFGIKPQELTEDATPFMQRIHPDDIEKAWKATLASMQNMTQFRMEYRFEHPQKGWIWVEAYSLPSAEPDGSIVWTGFISDITERKIADEKLQKSKELFFSAFHASPAGILITRITDGKIINANESFCRMFEYSREEAIGRTSVELNMLSPDEREKLIQQQIATGGLKDFELLSKTRSGKPINLLFSSEPMEINNEACHITTLIDISERKKAEKLIKESEEKYKDLVENIDDLICTHDLEGRILSMNRAAEKITGYKFDPKKNFNLKDIMTTGTRDKYDGYIADIQKNGHAQGLMKIKNKSGEVRIWEFKNSLKKTGENNPPIIRGYARDITERKKAEEALKESNFSLSEAQRIAKIGSWTYYPDGKLKWSDNVHQLYGLPSKITDTTPGFFFELVHPDDREKMQQWMQACLAGDAAGEYEFRSILPDGSIHYYSGSGEIKYSTENTPVYIRGTVQDVTEREKAGKALSESENRLRTILETEPECVKILGLKGELLSMNPAGLAMIEADNEEQVLGHQMIELVNPEYRKGFKRLTIGVFKGKPGTMEFEITGLKGSHRWLETHAVPFKNEEGKIVSLLGVTRDITHRKKAEEEIKSSNEQLRQLTTYLQSVREEERKRISREIHDELGQQLTAVKMDMAWIDKKLPKESVPLKEKLKNSIQLLDSSNLSIRKILNELRTGVFEYYDLEDAIEWQGRQFTNTTGIPVSVQYELNETVDETMATCFFRVFQEALTNITKYAKAKKVKTSLFREEDKLHLVVEDDGKGFDTGELKNKRSFGILGMKERVASLNGKFTLVSSPGKGTKISISLPYKKIVQSHQETRTQRKTNKKT